MSLDAQLPPPSQPDYQNPPPVAPAQKTSGLAIAGFIFAFVFSPIGFVLSLIALFKTGAGKAAGRGLAIAGLIISVLGTIVIGLLLAGVFAVANSKVLDAGCTDGKDAIYKSSTTVDEASVQATIDGLNAAAAKTKHDDVKAANLALAEDYKALLKGMKTGDAPADLQNKLTKDAEAFDKLCTIDTGN
ncbi:hypothetical protein GCM10010172_47890 [Paractinoplanes ferrugineus]|uniref:DUF4190 domain-containing protein n=1 Tax=Paractinoplanes ferrugineus TaxID=113564 RepID=A0A919IYA0_9ACTN|nr:DUF4190 domain-containing protein [Actinoplanes ferrugineus]GIE11050.1 hypothetical protein Afe05nite_28900 [Actinoplanes ferrugineus]